MQESILYFEIIQIVCYPLPKAPKVWHLLFSFGWLLLFKNKPTNKHTPNFNHFCFQPMLVCQTHWGKSDTFPLTSSSIPPLAPQPSSPQPSQLQVSLGPLAPLPPWEWSQWSPQRVQEIQPTSDNHEIRGVVDDSIPFNGLFSVYINVENLHICKCVTCWIFGYNIIAKISP